MKLHLTRDYSDIERKFLHRLIDIEAIYRAPLPLRKILVSPGSDGPPNQFVERDMSDIERKFLQRLIDIEAIYRPPLPLRKILVTPGSEGFS